MKKLIATAVLAASLPLSAAAWPGQQQGYDPTPRAEFRDHWTALSSFNQARRGTQSVRLAGKERRIDRVRLESVRGRPTFREVILEYGNGRTERQPLNITLQPGQDHVIAIAGDRRVNRITVVTDRRSNGVYSIYGG